MNGEGKIANFTKYVSSGISEVVAAKIDKVSEKNQLEILLENWELDKYQNLLQNIKKVLRDMKKLGIIERKDKIQFLSKFALNTEETLENCELIKYTLVCQVILCKYYKQVPDLKSISEFKIIPDYLEIYKILLTEELKCEQIRRKIPFNFEILTAQKNPNKLILKINQQNIVNNQINLIVEFVSKYNNFFTDLLN